MENTLDRYAIATKINNEPRYLSFSSQGSPDKTGSSIAGFDRMIFIDGIDDDTISDGKIKVLKKGAGQILTVLRDNKKVVTWDLAEKVRSLQATYGNENMEVPQDSLMLTHENYKIVFKSLSSSNNDDFYGNGVLFYKSNR